VDVIEKSGMSRASWYRLKAKEAKTPDVEQMIAYVVAAEFGTLPMIENITEPKGVSIDPEDEEEIDDGARRLDISLRTAIARQAAGTLVLKNGLWTETPPVQ
jgi:hypothetical protein